MTDTALTIDLNSDLGFESLCVHGDTPEAVQIASAVRDALRHTNVALRSFAA